MSEHPERWLSELYRASAREEPPDALDATIIATARKESRGWSSLATRWQAPLAAAAVIVVSVTVLIAVRNDQAYMERSTDHVTELHRSVSPHALEAPRKLQPMQEEGADRALKREAAPVQPTPSAARSDGQKTVVASDELDRKFFAMAAGETKAAKPDPGGSAALATPSPPAGPSSPKAAAEAPATIQAAPVPPAAPAPSTAPSSADAAVELREQARVQAAPTTTPAARPLAKASGESRLEQPESVQAPAERQPARGDRLLHLESREHPVAPHTWLERILKLRNEGRQTEAKESLAAFRRRYPDYPLPVELKDF